MENSDFYAAATLVAVLVGPILAVVATRFIDNRKERNNHKFEIFRALMQTRGLRLDPLHVAALNSIDLVFYRDKEVRKAYKAYLEHLRSPLPAESEQERFFSQRSALFAELLKEIGSTTKYSFDKHDLERLSYAPQGWDEDQTLQRRNNTLLNQVLLGHRPIFISNSSVNLQNAFPPPPE